MRDMVAAAADGTPGPAIHQVEYEGRMGCDCGLDAVRRPPSPKAHPGHGLTMRAGRRKRDFYAIAGNPIAGSEIALDLDLQPLQGRIDVAHSSSGRAFFPQHMPRFER